MKTSAALADASATLSQATTTDVFHTLLPHAPRRWFGRWLLAAALMVGCLGVTSAWALDSLVITEASSSSSTADWFEVTNTGATPVTMTGYKMDDSSFSIGVAVALNGVTTIGAGESVVFVECATTTPTEANAMRTAWNLPASVQVGWYSGSGVGLSSGGDGVCIFDSTGAEVSRQSFGAATTGTSFCWTTNNSTAVLSVVGVAGAYTPPPSTSLIGSPGLTANPAAPNTPTVTAATALTSTGFTANFATAASGSAATALILEVSTATDNFAANTLISATGATGQTAGITLAPTATSCAITGLLSNTDYRYRVKAVNAGGASAVSTAITATTNSAAPAVPDAPSATAATALTTTGFTANFAAATTGAAATGLTLEITTAADNFAANTFISATGATGQTAGISLGPTVTSSVISGLLSNTGYVYRVKAADAGGSSAPSSAITVTTLAAAGAVADLQFVYTSDAHYGITRAAFQGTNTVNAQIVNAAMVGRINTIPSTVLPADGGVGAGLAVGAIDFVMESGDIANREETPIQSSSASWTQFKTDYLDGLTVTDRGGARSPVLLLPGNHDVSNAIGYYKTMVPATDATAMAEIYNRMLSPAFPRTAATYNYATDKVHYSKDMAGVHFMFINMWPDSGERAWMTADLASVPATTPVVVFTHDQPDAESKHFTNPSGAHDINGTNKFENLLVDQLADGAKTINDPSVIEQRQFVAFLKQHPNITAYFHGNSNKHEAYTYSGPDSDIGLHIFRVDSPMKGDISSTDQTKLSFQVVSIDATAKKMTVRECLWNSTSTAGAPVVWGQSTTVDLQPRPVFTQDVASQMVTQGLAATFSVTVTGTPDPTLQWQTMASGATVWTNITNATGATYTTAATIATDNGSKFRCVATSGAGVACSSTAALLVDAWPEQLPIYGSDFGLVGASSIIRVDLQGLAYADNSGNPVSFSVQWQRKLSDGTWINIAGATGDELSNDTGTGMAGFQKGDWVRAAVTAFTSAGTAFSTFTSTELEIGNTPPVIDQAASGTPAITASPAPATADSVLTFNPAMVVVEDVDTQDTVSLNLQWQRLRHGETMWTNLPGATGDMLSADDAAPGKAPLFVKGDMLRVEVTAFDGTDFSDEILYSDELTIGNIAPEAADLQVGPVNHGEELDIDLSAGVTDADSADSFTYSVTTAQHGTLVAAGGAAGGFIYTANWPELARGVTGYDYFNYTAYDGTDAATASVTVSVVGGNHAPTVADATATATARGFVVTVSLSGVDSDGDSLEFLAGPAVADTAALTLLGGTAKAVTEKGGFIQAAEIGANGGAALAIAYTPPTPDFLGTDHLVFAARDDSGAVSGLATLIIDVRRGTPWFPLVDLRMFDPAMNAASPSGAYRIEIRNAQSQQLVLDVPVRNQQYVNPGDYLAYGSEGLPPAAYAVTVRKNSPTGMIVKGQAGAALAVNNYGAATAMVAAAVNHEDGSAGTAPEWLLGDNNWNFAFAVDNAAGYELRLTLPGGMTKTYHELFQPAADGTLYADQTVVRRGVYLGTAGQYRWSVRGFNPLGGAWTAERTFTVTSATAGTPPVEITGDKPTGLAPGLVDPAQPADIGTVRNGILPVTLSWNPVPGATAYRICLRTYGQVTVLNHLSTVLPGDAVSFGPVNLPADSYMWYVIAENAAGFSAWSDAACFRVLVDANDLTPRVRSFVHDPASITANGAGVRFIVTWDNAAASEIRLRIVNRDSGSEYATTLAVTPDAGNPLAGTVILPAAAAFNPLLPGATYNYRATVGSGTAASQSAICSYLVGTIPSEIGRVAIGFNAQTNPSTLTVTLAAGSLVPNTVELDVTIFDLATMRQLPFAGLPAMALPGNGQITLPASLRQAETIVTIRCRGTLPTQGKIGPWSELKGYVNTRVAQ